MSGLALKNYCRQVQYCTYYLFIRNMVKSQNRKALCPNLDKGSGGLIRSMHLKGAILYMLQLCVIQSSYFNKHMVMYTIVLTGGTSYREILSSGKQSRCFLPKLFACL